MGYRKFLNSVALLHRYEVCETAKVIAHSFEIEGEKELKNVILFKKVK